MLHPIIGQLERAAGFTLQGDARSKLSKLDASLSGSSASPQDAALFAELLSLPNDGRYPNLDLTPEQRRAKIFEALVSQLAALAGQRPLSRDSPDEPRTDLDGSDFLDCPEARMGGVDGY